MDSLSDNNRVNTESVFITDAMKSMEDFHKVMEGLAADLSEITGYEVKWKKIIDMNCALFGDFGAFTVKK